MYYGVLIAMAVWLLAGAYYLFAKEEWESIDKAHSVFMLLVLVVMGIVFGSIVELFQGTL